MVPLWLCATLASASMRFSFGPLRSWAIVGHGTSSASCRVALRRHHASASVLALKDLLRRLWVVRPLGCWRHLVLWLCRVLASWNMAWRIASEVAVLWLCLGLPVPSAEAGILRYHPRMVRLCECSSSCHVDLTEWLALAAGLQLPMAVRLGKALASWSSCLVECSLSCTWSWPRGV